MPAMFNTAQVYVDDTQ